MNDCDLCHEDTPVACWRGHLRVCQDCAAGIDYEASLTPAERRADHEAAALYVDESRGDW